MRTNVGLWWLLAVFGFLIAAVYTVWSLIQHGGVEWVGSVALVFLGTETAARRILTRRAAPPPGRGGGERRP